MPQVEPISVTVRERKGRFAFDPLWLLDAAGLVAAGVFAVTGFAEIPLPWANYAAPVRELSLAFAGVALLTRALALTLRRRDRRLQARHELLRRAAALNEALQSLRGALNRERVRDFKVRLSDLEAGERLAVRWLSTPDRVELDACRRVCDLLLAEVDQTIEHRLEFMGHANRLQRALARASGEGALSPEAADTLLSLVRDGLAVLDVGLWADLNADHFGRLSADRRAFRHEISRWSSYTADRLERQGLELFDRMIEHVKRKVAFADRLAQWEPAFRRLEARLCGLKPARSVAPTAPDRPLGERFALAAAPMTQADTDLAPRIKLAAAND